jgi:hypothetical protein
MNVERELQEAIGRKKLADYYYDNYRQCYLRKEYSKASEFIRGCCKHADICAWTFLWHEIN